MNMDDLITLVQLFLIGGYFGMSAPCIFTCLPPLFFYISSKSISPNEALLKIIILLIGKMTAYIILGTLLGFSVQILRMFLEQISFNGMKIITSAIIFLLGAFVWFDNGGKSLACNSKISSRIALNNSYSPLFILGFILGISPCPPLIALLFEMAFFIKSPLEGMLFLSSFGLGSLISGVLVFGIMKGTLNFLIDKTRLEKYFSSKLHQKICAFIIVIFGLFIIFK